MAKLSFNNTQNAFYKSLKTSVDQYFNGYHLKKTGNWRLYAKTGVLIPAAVLIYLGLLFTFQSGGSSLPVFVRVAGILFSG